MSSDVNIVLSTGFAPDGGGGIGWFLHKRRILLLYIWIVRNMFTFVLLSWIYFVMF